RVAVPRDAGLTSGGGQLGSLQSAAQSAGMELRPVGVREADEMERGIAAFAGMPNGGLIVTSSSLANFHRPLIISLAAQYPPPPPICRRRRSDLVWARSARRISECRRLH